MSRPPSGVPIDYASPGTTRPPRSPFLDMPPPGRVAAEIAAVLLAFNLFAEEEDTIVPLSVATCAFLAFVFVPCLIRTIWRPADGDAVGRRWWRVTGWMCVGLIALSVRYDACPHARYLRVGFVPVTVDGTPCANPRHFRNGPQLLWDWAAN